MLHSPVLSPSFYSLTPDENKKLPGAKKKKKKSTADLGAAFAALEADAAAAATGGDDAPAVVWRNKTREQPDRAALHEIIASNELRR